MPGVDGVELRGQPDGALPQDFLGQVGILDIHKVGGVKAADLLQHIGAHSHKAAGAELNAPGRGQILVLHGVVVVGFFERSTELWCQLAGQQQPGRGLAPGQVLQAAVGVVQLWGGHGRAGLGQQPFGHRLQNIPGQNNVGV